MNDFTPYGKNPEIGFGLSSNSDFMRIQDEKNKRILMEEQYNLFQMQKKEILAQQKHREEQHNEMLAQQEYRKFHCEEILAQQKHREEQHKDARLEKRLLIINTFIALAALFVSLFK